MLSVCVTRQVALVRVLRETAIAADIAASIHVDGTRPRHSNQQERLSQIETIGRRFGVFDDKTD
jgi:hypothetical protein